MMRMLLCVVLWMVLLSCFFDMLIRCVMRGCDSGCFVLDVIWIIWCVLLLRWLKWVSRRLCRLLGSGFCEYLVIFLMKKGMFLVCFCIWLSVDVVSGVFVICLVSLCIVVLLSCLSVSCWSSCVLVVLLMKWFMVLLWCMLLVWYVNSSRMCLCLSVCSRKDRIVRVDLFVQCRFLIMSICGVCLVVVLIREVIVLWRCLGLVCFCLVGVLMSLGSSMLSVLVFMLIDLCMCFMFMCVMIDCRMLVRGLYGVCEVLRLRYYFMCMLVVCLILVVNLCSSCDLLIFVLFFMSMVVGVLLWIFVNIWCSLVSLVVWLIIVMFDREEDMDLLFYF